MLHTNYRPENSVSDDQMVLLLSYIGIISFAGRSFFNLIGYERYKQVVRLYERFYDGGGGGGGEEIQGPASRVFPHKSIWFIGN